MLLVIKLHILFQAIMPPLAQYHLMLQTKLNDLSRQKTVLLSQRLEFLTLRSEKTKDEVVVALNEAVLQMCRAADTAFDAAVTRLEKVDKDGCKSMDELLGRISNLFAVVRRTEGVYFSLEGSPVSDREIRLWFAKVFDCVSKLDSFLPSYFALFNTCFIYSSTVGYENSVS